MRKFSLSLFIVFSLTAFGWPVIPIELNTDVAQTTLIIVRHGISDYDPARPVFRNGVPDPPLTKEGREQAERLGKLVIEKHVNCIYHSPLIRARETAEIASRNTDIQLTAIESFTEFNLGDLLGKDWSQSPYREQLADVFRDPESKRPGGESFNEMYDRVIGALRPLLDKHRNQTLLIVAHGITNRAIVGLAHDLSKAEAYKLPSQPNTQAFIIRWTGKIPAEIETHDY